MDQERLSAARVVVGSSWREEMGERRANSCTEVNRRSLCVLPTKKICDQLSVSVSQKAITGTFWVFAVKGCIGGSPGRGGR